jgi:meso-butanediol dehydrogenase/(S,S)-butanediol dehydrogenase/diacetyl reductase
MPQHEGRVVIVTGASQGIGRAIAEKFHLEGASVVGVDLAPPKENEAGGPGIEFQKMDVTSAEDVEGVFGRVVEQYGRLDVLVNNAGIMFEKSLEEMTEAEWDKMMAVNLKGVFLCSKAAVGRMRAGGGGAIVNIGSLEGLACNPLHTAYAASKGGVHALTRAMAVDLGVYNIRCNAICPGWINTAFNDAYFNILKDRDQGLRAVTALHPICRLGLPEDVANTASWLAGDEAGFVTGQEIVVDGGRTCRPSLPDFDAMEKKDAV